MRKLHTAGGGRRATRLTIMSAVFIWILAIVCAIPAAVASYIKVLDIDSNKHINVCHPFPDSWGKHYGKIMVIAKFLIYYAIPLIIISFFYLLMARHLILSTLHIPGEMQTQARQVRARKKVAKMVLAFVIVFAICFFPQHVFLLWFYSDPVAADANYNQYWHAFRIIGFCLSFINSCINPIALYCVSGTFRKHFNRYLLCNCFKKSANGRGRGMAGSNNSCRASITSRRHLGTITSSRRYAQCTKSTWDSTTMANYTSVARKQTLGNQSTEEISITTFMNGGFLGSGKEMHVEN
jgi:hypothetical protein